MGVSRRKERGNRWQARLILADGRTASRLFDRKTDAERWYGEQLAARERGDALDPASAKLTLAEFYADWAPRQLWERNTVASMDLSMRSATFADIPLRRLRRSHIEAWIKKLDSEDKSPGTIRTRLVNVRSVIRAAVRDRLLPSDPSEGVVLPRQRRREAAMRLPLPEEVAALLQHAENWFRPFVMLCGVCGLRLGEAAAVQVDDIDFLRRKLNVRRQVQRVSKGKVEIRPPKYGSERTLVLPDELLAMLAQHVATCETEWLFPSRYGYPNRVALIYAFEQTCKRAGVSATVHELRHFAASGLIEAGLDVVTVQKYMGHSSAATTLSVYSHLWPSAEDRTRQAAAGLMSQVLAPDRHQAQATER